jgi:hypothetical protein
MVRMPMPSSRAFRRRPTSARSASSCPTVDDALEARDAARYSRYPPYGRRSAGGGQYNQIWSGLNYRQTINDNMLVTVMIETLEGVAMADEIAATHGVDVVILGNNDLSSFSGWNQNDPRYQDAIIKVHDAALKYGKYYGNAGAQYLRGLYGQRGHPHGPERSGVRRMDAAWPRRPRPGASPDEEPLIGLPAGAAPTAAPAAPARDAGSCWK